MRSAASTWLCCTVCRQGFCDQWRPKLRESLAHLVRPWQQLADGLVAAMRQRSEFSGFDTIRMSAPTSLFRPGRICSESPESADSVEKHCVASAENGGLKSARAPFLSCFSHLLRCRKDLGQFPEVLGGCGEQEFVTCTACTDRQGHGVVMIPSGGT